jgi:hypothetical protein
VHGSGELLTAELPQCWSWALVADFGRWINEQLYSNPSVEAVAMMKKEPKIFEDVCPAVMITGAIGSCS